MNHFALRLPSIPFVLKNHTIFQNSQLEGYLLTKYSKKATDFDVTIKLGNMEFDYSNSRWKPLISK
jgi:hypothetical protein|tara:strand:- start:85 stop:282 length:198 start_codon:yes stop_codon:yes gene_type:complete